jgi:hypothetical protein
VAFFIGLAVLLLSSLLLGIAPAVPWLRSRLFLICFGLACLGLVVWVLLLTVEEDVATTKLFKPSQLREPA